MSARRIALRSLLLVTLGVGAAFAQIDSRLVGIWSAQVTTPIGAIQTQLILQPNGSYTQLTTDTGGHASRIWGTWFVPSAGVLRLNVQGYAPTEYRGRAIAAPPSDLVQYRFLDANRVQTGTGVIYYRSQ